MWQLSGQLSGQRKHAQVYLSGMHEVSAAYLQDMLEEQLVARDVCAHARSAELPASALIRPL